MKNNLFYFLQIFLVVILGFCGLILLITGVCMHKPIPSIMGILFLIMPLIAIKYK